MAVVTMPALSPTMTDGTLSRWLVSEGDAVRSGDVIAEIETDKALMEVEAIDDGHIKLLVAAGSKGVAVGTVIAEIAVDGESPESAPESAPETAPASPVPEATSAPAPTPTPAPKSMPETTPAPETKPSKPTPTPDAPPSDTLNNAARVFASPLARRIAREQGIDLNAIKGTGPKGRIIRADIEASPSASVAQTALMQDATGSTVIENSKMRLVIAERLQKSMQEAPHFFLNADIAIDAMLEVRKTLNDAAQEGVKVSVNDMIIKAAAQALIQHPKVNSSWEASHIRQHHHANIAVAVSTEAGLITPIVTMAEARGLYDIAMQTRELADKARQGKLSPEEYSGGSFTISNLGMYGTSSFTAIINPPHSAILAIGAGEARAVVRNGEITIATMMTATLACDHRVIDGADGAEWLASFKRFVENPVLALG